MTRRYIARAGGLDFGAMDCGDEFYDDAKTVGQTIHEPERSPRWTGLYDAHGNKLYAVDEREPIGFVRGR